MNKEEQKTEILRRYFVDKWKIGTIARQLNLHHSTVRRIIASQTGEQTLPVQKKPRKIDPYLPFIRETLEKYPTLTASRLYDMVVVRGYDGKQSQFRSIIAEIRPRRTRYTAYARLSTLPGEQAQVDWGHFGSITFGTHQRQLSAFVMVLSYSRAIYLTFFPSARLHCFLEGHRQAFEWFGGVAKVCLYDNLKSAVIERSGSMVRFNSQFLQFAQTYLYEPRPVAVARGNEKGRVERAIRFIRDRFFSGRTFSSLDDLNQQALNWCQTVSLERQWPPERTRYTVGQKFKEEQPCLLALPANPHSCEEVLEASVGKTPYVRFDSNDYSIPHSFVGKTVVLRVSTTRVRVVFATEVIASHTRCWEKHAVIENNQHLQDLWAEKRNAAKHGKVHTLTQAVPATADLLKMLISNNHKQAALHGVLLQQAVNHLFEMLTLYGEQLFTEAVSIAVKKRKPHPHAVRSILEKLRASATSTKQTAITTPAIALDDPRVPETARYISPGNLESYDLLFSSNEQQHNSLKDKDINNNNDEE